MMRSLEECRPALDEVDRDIVRLFEQRMMIARDVAAYKIARDLPVLDRSREEIVLRETMLKNAAKKFLCLKKQCLVTSLLK